MRGIVPNEKKDKGARVIQDIRNESLTEGFYMQKSLAERWRPIEDVLKRIQAEVTLRRIRIREFFIDFDNLRKNIVTGFQFRRILNTLNLPISEAEYQ